MKGKSFIPGNQLEMRFYIPFPKSWSKKKQALMYFRPHQSAPDIDNLVKGVMDSIFENKGGDHTVHEIHATKKWAEKGMIAIKNLKANPPEGGEG